MVVGNVVGEQGAKADHVVAPFFKLWLISQVVYPLELPMPAGADGFQVKINVKALVRICSVISRRPSRQLA